MRKTTLTVFFHTIFLHKQPAPRCGLLMEKPGNAHIVQRGSLCPDRTRREDPLMVLPSHIPPLCVEEGFYILGLRPRKLLRGHLFGVGIRGAQPLHRLEKRCPDKSAAAFAGHPQNLCRALLRAAGRPPVPAVKRTEGSLRRRCAPPGLRPAPAPRRDRPLRKPLTPALPEPTSGSGNPAGC